MADSSGQRRLTVVDDSPELLELFGDALGFDGVEVTLRSSATLRDIEQTAPDVLLMDLRLGTDGLAGLDMIRLVRSHPELRRVPIIVCTAAIREVGQHEAELDRIPDLVVLTKPFALRELEACVGEALAGVGVAARGS
jgi:CheY-like chemotaxis protein